MKIYVYQEKKKIAVALVQMYEYSAEYAAKHVGVEKKQVLKWLYEYNSTMPNAPFFSQKRLQRNTPQYTNTEKNDRFNNIFELK